MKMSSEGGDTRFPDNLRVPAKVVTGWGHKKKGVETLGRVAVKINGKGQKLWVFPAAIHSGEPPPSPDARDGEVARAPKRQRRQPAAAAGAANDVVELQAKVTLGGQAVEASMALTPGALGFAEVEEVDCQFFRFLGTMLRDLGIERLSLQPSRRGTDAAATNLADLQALAASADGSDWLVTLLTALCGGDQLTGFVMAEMTKKTANRNRVNPLHPFYIQIAIQSRKVCIPHGWETKHVHQVLVDDFEVSPRPPRDRPISACAQCDLSSLMSQLCASRATKTC